jgi:iron complex transport system substrate-binding protein
LIWDFRFWIEENTILNIEANNCLPYLLRTLILLSVCVNLGCRDEGIRIAPGTLPVESRRVVNDDLGREVRVPFKIERIISLAPNITEMIFAVGAGDKLVGVTTYCNYPAEAKSIQKVGDTVSPNIETIISLRPEVVFVSTASQLEAFTKTLDSQGVSVFVINATSLDDVYRSLGQLGEMFWTSEQAKTLVTDLRSREEMPYPHGERPNFKRVFIQISNEPLFTVGKKSFLTQVVEKAGGELVTKDIDDGYPKLSKETALALDPEVIILSNSEDNQRPNDAFQNSPAVKNGRVYKINADIISRPGPRLVDAIEQIAVFLHGNDSNKLKTEN